jgi:hypothetical protein
VSVVEEGGQPRLTLLDLEAGAEDEEAGGLYSLIGQPHILLKNLALEFDERFVKRESLTEPWVSKA